MTHEHTLCALVFAILVALVSGCTSDGPDAAGVSDTAVLGIPPESFEASIGGFLGASYRVELRPDASLLYSRNARTFTSAPGTERVEVEVTAEQWRAFRAALDEAGVWDWKKDYRNRGVLDGTQWHLKIRYHDASVDSHGSNAFPPKREYERFRRAVSALLGGRDFR